MRFDIQLCKGFSVLDPLQLASMSNGEVVQRLNVLREGEELVNGRNPYRRFTGVKGFNENVQETLIAQLPAYRLAAEAFAPILVSVKPAEQPAKLWEWWWSMRNEEGLSQWGLLARIAVLHQPSSAVVERFFSVYKGMTSPQQCQEDEETSFLRSHDTTRERFMTRKKKAVDVSVHKFPWRLPCVIHKTVHRLRPKSGRMDS